MFLELILVCLALRAYLIVRLDFEGLEFSRIILEHPEMRIVANVVMVTIWATALVWCVGIVATMYLIINWIRGYMS